MATSTTTKPKARPDQLDRLRQENEALRDQLQQAHRLATLGTMAAMVAHEFNNILTPIINYAQLAQSNPALVDKAIARTVDGGQRASDICGAILGLTRDELPEPVEVRIEELVESTLSAIGRAPVKDGIELTLDIRPGLTLRTRPVMLQQVLLNLVLNARHALLGGRRPRLLTISAAEVDDNVEVTVADNGEGIDPAILERIFEPFFTTKRDVEGCSDGFGLGLAICQQIATSLGGRITVDSTPGEGSRFTIRLPAE